MASRDGEGAVAGPAGDEPWCSWRGRSAGRRTGRVISRTRSESGRRDARTLPARTRPYRARIVADQHGRWRGRISGATCGNREPPNSCGGVRTEGRALLMRLGLCPSGVQIPEPPPSDQALRRTGEVPGTVSGPGLPDCPHIARTRRRGSASPGLPGRLGNDVRGEVRHRPLNVREQCPVRLVGEGWPRRARGSPRCTASRRRTPSGATPCRAGDHGTGPGGARPGTRASRTAVTPTAPGPPSRPPA